MERCLIEQSSIDNQKILNKGGYLMILEDGPLVTIIITTYKRPHFLERAINSVLQQTYKNIEIIIVDDNDSDSKYRIETEGIMQKYMKVNNMFYLKHVVNMNGATARNTGLKSAKGKYITYLDDDDRYRPSKVKEQLEFLLKNIEYKAVYCGWKMNGIEETPNVQGDLSYEILSGKLLIRTNTIMMERKVALEINGWDESYRRNQEAAYLLRYFQANHKIGSVKSVLVDYDMSDRSNASCPKNNEKDMDFFLTDHFELIEKIDKNFPGSKKKIFLSRKIGILLSYLKNKNIINSLRIYKEAFLKYPISVNIALVSYILNRYS